MRPAGIRSSGRGIDALVVLTLCATLVPLVGHSLARDGRSNVKPGFNLFKPGEDVELGAKAAESAEEELKLLRDSAITRYVSDLGQSLANRAPGHGYPYTFKVVDDDAINAFAFPGGPIYVNRGLIEAADNEAQLAGVIGHEISHVALRHGTNQISKAYLVKVPAAMLGGEVGGGLLGTVTKMGTGLGLNAAFMRFSRKAETQADTLGAQIVHDAGYDPREMAVFFKKLDAQRKREPNKFEKWFSSHPQPKNREKKVDKEIGKLGGVKRNARRDSAEFHRIQTRLKGLPRPTKKESRQ